MTLQALSRQILLRARHQAYPRFRTIRLGEGFESSTECTGEGVGENAFSWGFDGMRVRKWGDGSSSAFGVEWEEGDVLGLACDMVNKSVFVLLCQRLLRAGPRR
jgi:hypothetical protein